MSYDVYLRASKCEKCGHFGPEPECYGPTYNLGPIFTLLITGKRPEELSEFEHCFFTKGKKYGLGLLNAMTGKESIPFLEKALINFELMRDMVETLKPSNGWGTPRDAYEVLERMLSQAKEYPDNVWEIR